MLVVDGERLLGELVALAAFSEGNDNDRSRSLRDDGKSAKGKSASPSNSTDEVCAAVTRVVFSAEDLAARAYLRGLAQAAGLAVRVDAVGNTFFRWEGTRPERAAVATGSHADAIPNAGMYDGTVGVLGGLEALRALKAAGFKPERAIELVLFTSEEPTRFGLGCLGSRMLAGTTSAEAARGLRDQDGLGLEVVRAAAGFTGELESVRLAPGHYAGFVELHIEQGPELEREGVAIGIVQAIAAPASWNLFVDGEGGHAGALLMARRHDALVAAAEMVLAVEAAALATGFEDTVATVGICDVFPGAVNSVPARVRLSLDVRDVDEARRDGVLAAIEASCGEIAVRRGVRMGREALNADAPAACDAGVMAAVEAACAEAGVATRRMVSRAYHDSLFMARICPVGMVFVPCRAGVSHRPDEFVRGEDLVAGVRVLAGTLARLSGL